MILLDTSGLLSAIDASQRQHAGAWPPSARRKGNSELDHLLSSRVGTAAQQMLLDEVARGAYLLEPLSVSDVAAALDVIVRYGDLNIELG